MKFLQLCLRLNWVIAIPDLQLVNILMDKMINCAPTLICCSAGVN